MNEKIRYGRHEGSTCGMFHSRPDFSTSATVQLAVRRRVAGQHLSKEDYRERERELWALLPSPCLSLSLQSFSLSLSLSSGPKQ